MARVSPYTACPNKNVPLFVGARFLELMKNIHIFWQIHKVHILIYHAPDFYRIRLNSFENNSYYVTNP